MAEVRSGQELAGNGGFGEAHAKDCTEDTGPGDLESRYRFPH